MPLDSLCRSYFRSGVILSNLTVTEKSGQLFICVVYDFIMSTNASISPSEIERETGFGKGQLRKWRQRFGFPLLESMVYRNSAYSRQTVDKLLLIKRLLEAGFRPGQVVGMTTPELEKLLLGLVLSMPVVHHDESIQACIGLLKRLAVAELLLLLAELRAKGTLADFVSNTVAPLMIDVGAAWMRNEIEIYHEHLCTCCIERYLQSEILKLKPKYCFPIVLFALTPEEHHLIGLLLDEAAISEWGASTINIGLNIPLNQLKLAAISCKADVVALSFSAYYPARKVVPTLRHFRYLLPTQIQIWAGGSGLAGLRMHPKGVRIFSELNGVVAAMNEAVGGKNLV